MQEVLQDKYYNTNNLEKYLVQTRSPVKSSGIKLPEDHGIGKGLDPNVQPEKTSCKTYDFKSKESFVEKTQVRTSGVGIRCRIETPTICLIVQAVEKPLKIPKVLKHVLCTAVLGVNES